jgi:hypothetical protein
MPCEGCPEHAPPDNPQGTAILVHTGGPPETIFKAVQHVLAKDMPTVIRKWSTPTVESDGALVYKQDESDPPEIEGYKRDPTNPKRLRPIWPHCVWRAFRVWRDDTGCVRIVATCLTPLSGLKAHEATTLKYCKHCAHRSTR